jgi:hypothetical protein
VPGRSIRISGIDQPDSNVGGSRSARQLGYDPSATGLIPMDLADHDQPGASPEIPHAHREDSLSASADRNLLDLARWLLAGLLLAQSLLA